MPKISFQWLVSLAWYWRAVRIALLVGLGWGAIQLVNGAGSPPFALKQAWPKTDFANASIALDEITSGGPPRDGIPSIDYPRFVPVKAARLWLDQYSPVIALDINGYARAYPLEILIWHEIVNDVLSGVPISVTFCPLCNAAIVFERTVGNRMLDFGTTGLLRKSDLVMYDRQTESFWQQFTGEGIVGHYRGEVLKQVPSRVVSFDDFSNAYPDGEVLSRSTGFIRRYGQNPYRGYDRVGENPFLFFNPIDQRLPAMERVLGVTVESHSRVYPFSVLKNQPVINDQIGDTPIVVFSRDGMSSALDQSSIRQSRLIKSAAAFDRRMDKQVLTFERVGDGVKDHETGSTWDVHGIARSGPLKGKRLKAVEGGVHFAFAWLAFRPESRIYNGKQ